MQGSCFAARPYRSIGKRVSAAIAHRGAVAGALRDLAPAVDGRADRLTVTFRGQRITLDLDRDEGTLYVPTFIYYQRAERGQLDPVLAEAIEFWAVDHAHLVRAA